MPAPSQHISDMMALIQGRWWWWFRPCLGALAHPSFQAPLLQPQTKWAHPCPVALTSHPHPAGLPRKLSPTRMPLVVLSPRQTQPFPQLPLTCGCSY